jgi:hypothetical protein
MVHLEFEVTMEQWVQMTINILNYSVLKCVVLRDPVHNLKFHKIYKKTIFKKISLLPA